MIEIADNFMFWFTFLIGLSSLFLSVCIYLNISRKRKKVVVSRALILSVASTIILFSIAAYVKHKELISVVSDGSKCLAIEYSSNFPTLFDSNMNDEVKFNKLQVGIKLNNISSSQIIDLKYRIIKSDVIGLYGDAIKPYDPIFKTIKEGDLPVYSFIPYLQPGKDCNIDLTKRLNDNEKELIFRKASTKLPSWLYPKNQSEIITLPFSTQLSTDFTMIIGKPNIKKKNVICRSYGILIWILVDYNFGKGHYTSLVFGGILKSNMVENESKTIYYQNAITDFMMRMPYSIQEENDVRNEVYDKIDTKFNVNLPKGWMSIYTTSLVNNMWNAPIHYDNKSSVLFDYTSNPLETHVTIVDTPNCDFAFT